MQVEQLPRRGRAQEVDEPSVIHLLGDVAIQPVVPRDHDLGGPSPRLDPQDAELDRQPRRLAFGSLDVRVDPPDERPDDLGTAGMVMVQLRAHLAAERELAGPDVGGQGPGPLDLRHRAGRLSPPELELEEPIVRGVVPLRQEEVVLVLGIDVSDSPPVAHDLHRLPQPGDRELLLAGMGDRRRQHDQRQQDTQPGPSPIGPRSIIHRTPPPSSDHRRAVP